MRRSEFLVKLGLGLLVGFVVLISGFVIAVNAAPHFMSAQDLLGNPLPSSAQQVQIAVHNQFFGEYNGYLRFTIAPNELNVLLNRPGMWVRGQTKNPLDVFANSNLAPPTAKNPERPQWWQPEQAPVVLIASYGRPQASAAGSDFAWYMIDQSDPNQYIVYVYILEV